MRTPTKILGALAIAGLIATGGSAFTASNTGIDDAVAGYGSATISGIVVSNTQYVIDTADSTKLSSVVFTTSTDVFTTPHEAMLQVNALAPTACDITSASVITCDTTAEVASVTKVALTVAAS